MNNIIHEYLNKLRLISKLQEGQSLDTTNGITIYNFTYLNWVWRKWNRDNKDEVTKFLQEFYKSIDQSVEQIISDLNTTKDENKKKKLISIIINLAEKIKLSFKGLESLSKTYISYPKTISIIEGIVQDFAIITYKHLIEVIPFELLLKTLKENILYNGDIIYIGFNERSNQNNAIIDDNAE